MNLTAIFNKPYPQTLNKWKLSVGIGLFISLFLLIFQPFGLNNIDTPFKEIRLAGYGLVTFVILVLDLKILPWLIPKLFNEDRWTLIKQILLLCWIVISISAGNYLYSVAVSIVYWVGAKGFLLFVFFTFTVALIPVIIITFISQNIYLKQNLAASGYINDHISGELIQRNPCNDMISVSSGKQKYKFRINEIILLESEGNYINIRYMKDDEVKTQLIRNTIKNIEHDLVSDIMIKCHRAFIINLLYVKKVKGNSQGYSLIMDKTDYEVPVARTYTKEFKKRILELA